MSPTTKPTFSMLDEPWASFVGESVDLTVEELIQRVSGAYNQGYIDGQEFVRSAVRAGERAIVLTGNAHKTAVDNFTRMIKELADESD